MQLIYLHSVGLSRAGLPISKDTHVKAINTGSDQRLHLLEHLSNHKRRDCIITDTGNRIIKETMSSGTNLLLSGLSGKDFVKFKGHELALIG